MTQQKYNALRDQLSDMKYLSVEMRDALPVIVIRHADFSADLAIQGAQLLRFAVQDSEWLWLSETAEYKTGTSLRGGIPICWPWFGPFKPALFPDFDDILALYQHHLK